MRIALASVPVVNRNVEWNKQEMIRAIEMVCGKADVILFGESVLQGFDCLNWDYETDCRIALALTDSAVEEMRHAARTHKMAVSFGFIEKTPDALFSSQVFIGDDGEIVNLFHRVSPGWKVHQVTDGRYQEGKHFEKFRYRDKSFAVGLCGDLWTDGRPQEMKALDADVVIWPVWCDYPADEWNRLVKYEYAEQAALCGRCVLYVNPFCVDKGDADMASGGAACFRNGCIASEITAGDSGILIVEL